MAGAALAIGTILGASGTAATALGATMIISGGLAVGSMAMQHKATSKAAKAQKKQLQASNRISKIKERKAKVKQVRQERISRALGFQRAARAGGGTPGLVGASGFQGAMGSLASQTASNIGMMGQISREQDTMVGHQMDMYEHQKDASMWGAVGQLSGSIFQNLGGFGTVAKGMKTPKPKPSVPWGGNSLGTGTFGFKPITP